MSFKTFILGGVLLVVTFACSEKNSPPSPDPKPVPSPEVAPAGSTSPSAAAPSKGEAQAAKAAAKIISALPAPSLVEPVVNPKKAKPYAGPTGSVRGVVRGAGDKAPYLEKVVEKMESSCDISRRMFGSLFREGDGRELADVLVAVTHYEGYVPSKQVDVDVFAKGCSWDARTYAITYGQRLNISGVDNRPYVPELLGQPMPAQLFVLPTAPPVQLPPKQPGRYQLVDSMRLFNVAEVFVLPYATVDVTDVKGTFEIKGIPVGDVQINALLPQTGATVEKKIKIEAGKVTELDFELTFDLKAFEASPKETPLDELPAPGKPEP